VFALSQVPPPSEGDWNKLKRKNSAEIQLLTGQRVEKRWPPSLNVENRYKKASVKGSCANFSLSTRTHSLYFALFLPPSEFRLPNSHTCVFWFVRHWTKFASIGLKHCRALFVWRQRMGRAFLRVCSGGLNLYYWLGLYLILFIISWRCTPWFFKIILFQIVYFQEQ